MELTTNNFMKQQKQLRTLQQCKQIPKDDRLLIRKYLHEGNNEVANILDDHKNKKLQIKLRKFLQRQKQNRKRRLSQKNNYVCEDQIMQKNKQTFNERNYDMFQHLIQFKQSLENKSKTEANSLKNSYVCTKLYDDTLKTQQNNIIYSKTTQKPSSSDLFTPPNFLNDIKSFSRSNSKNKVYETHIQKPTQIFESAINIPFTKISHENYLSSQLTDPEQLKEQLLKTTLIQNYAEDIFSYISQKHFPLSISSNSVYLPYRRVLQEIKKYTEMNKDNRQLISYPSSLSSSKISSSKLSSIISPNSQHQIQNPKSFIDESSCKIPILSPFQSQFQAVTIEKLGLFLSKYCLRKNNQIRNLFIIMGYDSNNNKDENMGQSSGQLSVQRFTKINQWKGQQIINKFKTLVQKWGNNHRINYWRMFSVKEQKQVTQFLRVYKSL